MADQMGQTLSLARIDREPEGRARCASWIVSPAFDLLFLVNAGWVLAFLPGFLSAERTPHIEFWQIYFLTTPHRWITLLLVATDPDRRLGRGKLFAAMAVMALVVVSAVRWASGGFVCLLLIDYVWNAWHFAAQHAGILRMYSRKCGGGHPRLETWCLRATVFYTSLRLAGWSTGWTEAYPTARSGLTILDVVMSLPVVLLFAVELIARPWRRPGKMAYLTSVSTMYLSLLASVALGWTTLILSLTAAAAAFHAIEYLAVVSHYAQRRRTHGAPSLFSKMARAWGSMLALYVILFGMLAQMADVWSHEIWLGVNLWAAGLHYAYDGMIWKLRAAPTAQTLGVELPARESAAPPSRKLATAGTPELVSATAEMS
jgi:hypothetical protein